MATDRSSPSASVDDPRGSGAASPQSPPATSWLWLLAGIAGGACAGAGDALAAVIRGVGGLGAVKALWLLMLASSLLGLLGLVAGALVALAGRLTARAAAPRRARQIAASAVALPLLIYDAFALFTGHRAAAIPGHQAISLLLAAGGASLVYLATGRLDDLIG